MYKERGEKVNGKKILIIILIIIGLVINYFLASFLANLLNISDVVFKSMTGMTPDIKGNIMLFIVFVFIESLIILKIYNVRVKQKWP